MPAPPPSRDRLGRPVDISGLLDGATRRVGLMVDEPGLHWAGLSGHGYRNVSVRGDVCDSGSAGSPVGVQRAGMSRGRNMQRQLQTGRDYSTPGITVRRGSIRGRGRSQLPSWYPRTPLRDITGIMRAIERRRAELGRNQDNTPQEESNTAVEANNAQLEFDVGPSTPIPIAAIKPQSSPAIQIWKPKPGGADWSRDDSHLLTPQKKLLNSIEKVREVWLEEQRKLERTPAAKKAEREKKVRLLMSMR